MEYGKEISNAASFFGYGSSANAIAAKPDHLEQPAEIGLGVSMINKSITYTVDYKTIKWADAKGYKDFGWEDQNVLALGAKYQANRYWLGLGYNSSNNPIKNNKDKTNVWSGTLTAPSQQQGNTNGDTMNVFNYVMFPGTITKAYTLGGGYDIGKTASIQIAHTIMPEVSDTVSGASVGVGDLTTKHSQSATTIAYTFSY
jgi:long-chain fatty acid transport protein